MRLPSKEAQKKRICGSGLDELVTKRRWACSQCVLSVALHYYAHTNDTSDDGKAVVMNMKSPPRNIDKLGFVSCSVVR